MSYMHKDTVAFFIVFVVAFTAGYFLSRDTQNTDERALLQGTFCENLLEVRRMVSSRYPTEFDTAPDEYYTRGIVSASIDFNNKKYPEAQQFQTAITEGVFNASGPNFAGHYTVASWGCGSTCYSHAVVDNNTGDIISFGLQSEYGAGTSLDTKVLILNPKENFPTLEASGMAPGQAKHAFARIPREYYVLSNDDVTGEPTLSLFCTESAGSHYVTM